MYEYFNVRYRLIEFNIDYIYNKTSVIWTHIV